MPNRRLVFLLLGWLGMVHYFAQRWIYGPVIPALMTEFGVDKTALGLIGSASLWGYMLTPIPAGVLSDKFGRKQVLIIGLVGFSALTIISGLVISPRQLFAGRFLTGVAEALFFIPTLAFTLDVFPERPGLFLTLMVSGSSLGLFVGPALAGWLLDLTGNWRIPFFATGTSGIVLSIFMLIFWPRVTVMAQGRTLLDRGLIVPQNLPMLICLSLAAAFQISAEFGFTMWFPAVLKIERQMTAALAGTIAGMYGLGQFIGRPILGWVSDRVGYRRLGIFCALVFGGFLILALWMDSPRAIGLMTGLSGFFAAAVMGTIWTFTGLVFPAYKGFALGVITTVAYVTAALAPILIGYVSDLTTVTHGLWVVAPPAAFLAALALLATFIFRRARER